jgi:mRNA interferase MazF
MRDKDKKPVRRGEIKPVRQGEVWLADLKPAVGVEQRGYRPVVILSGNMLNSHLPLVFAAPLTTRVKRYKGNPVILPETENGLAEASELLVFHFRSMSRERLVKKIGSVRPRLVAEAIKTLNDLLRF